MPEREKFPLRKIVRNSAVAVGLATTAIFAKVENIDAKDIFGLELPQNPTSTLTLSHHPVLSQITNESIFEQADPFLETTTGRAITAALTALALARGYYTLKRSWELDNKRKLAEAATASVLFFSLSCVLLADSFKDVNSHLAPSLIFAYSLAQSAYMLEDTLQRDRSKEKRGSAIASSALLASIGLTIFIDSIK
jgi:hypothetical protein